MTCHCREYETCELCTSAPLKHLRCSRCRGTGVVDHCRDDYCTKTRVCPKCEGVRLDEQAAASVPSRERDVDMKVRGMRDAVEIMRNIAPQALAALPQIEAAIEAIWRGAAPASDNHLDGGARALDASEARAASVSAAVWAEHDAQGVSDRIEGLEGVIELRDARIAKLEHDHADALREARVQGMREALEIVHLSDAIMSPRSMCSIERGIDAAIEAVRKGER